MEEHIPFSVNGANYSLPKSLMNAITSAYSAQQKPATLRPLDKYPAHELVMELISRGYAVAKMPAEELAEGVGG